MINILYSTNLDEAKRAVACLNLVYPDYVPQLGSMMRFTVPHNDKVFDLEVIGVKYNAALMRTEVELHTPKSYRWSIQNWTDHIKRLHA